MHKYPLGRNTGKLGDARGERAAGDLEGDCAAADPQAEAAPLHRQARDLAGDERGRDVASHRHEVVASDGEADVAREYDKVRDPGRESTDSDGPRAGSNRLAEGVAQATGRDRPPGRHGGCLGGESRERARRLDAREVGHGQPQRPVAEFEDRARGACDQPEPPVLNRQAAPLLGDTASGDRIAYRHERVASDGEAKAASERHEAGDVGPEALDREAGRTCGQLGGEGEARGADGQPRALGNRHEPGRAVLHDHAVGGDAGQAVDRGRKAALDFQGQSAAPADQSKRAVGERDLTRVGYGEHRLDATAQGDQRAVTSGAHEGEAQVARERDKVGQCGGQARQREGRGAGLNRLGERVRHAAHVEPLARGDRPAARGRAEEDRLGGSRVESGDVEVEVGPTDFEGRLAGADRKAEGSVAKAHRRKFAAVERCGDSTPHGDKPHAVMAEAHATGEREKLVDRRRKALDREGGRIGGDCPGERVGGGARVEPAARGDCRGGRCVLGKDRAG